MLKILECTGVVAEGRERFAKYSRFAYVAPHDRLDEVIEAEGPASDAQPEPVETASAAPPVEPMPPSGIVVRVPGREATIAEVQAAFCAAFAEAGGEDGQGQPYTAAHLKSPRRFHRISWPRHVCMDLVRRIVPGPVNGRVSLPAIGKAFGGFDHTSVMHAVWRTPHHLAEDATLAAAHARVLEQFSPVAASPQDATVDPAASISPVLAATPSAHAVRHAAHCDDVIAAGTLQQLERAPAIPGAIAP